MRPPNRSALISITGAFWPEFQKQGLSAPRLLLHGAGGRSGIFLDPAADRLARLQRLHGRHQADQGVRRLVRAGARSRATWTSSWPSMRWRWPIMIDHLVLFSGDGDFRSLVEALQRKGRKVTRRLDPVHPAADDRRRTAPPGRPLRRPCQLRDKVGRDPSERAPAPGRARRRTSFDDEFEDDEADLTDRPPAGHRARPRLPALPAPGRVPRRMAGERARTGTTRRCRPSATLDAPAADRRPRARVCAAPTAPAGRSPATMPATSSTGRLIDFGFAPRHLRGAARRRAGA